MKLTDLSIRALPFEEGQRDYADLTVQGMYLRVGKQTKTFMVNVYTGATRKRVTLGRFPNDLTLGKARELARLKIAQARIAKTEAESIRFEDAVELYYRVHGQKQRIVTRLECQRLLEKHFRPVFGKRHLEDIRPTAIAAILDTIPSEPVRRNAFVFLRAFFNWSYRRGYLDVSPMARLERPADSTPRERVLTIDELVAIWNACPNVDYGYIVKLCILSGQRIGQWSRWKPEYLQGDLIVWPAAAMKAAKTHTLPATPGIRALINSRQGLTPWRQPDSRSMQRLRKLSGVHDANHHDCRRSLATICAEELGIAPHVIEMILAHYTGSQVSRTYNRSTLIKPMREALEAYENLLMTRLDQSKALQAAL